METSTKIKRARNFALFGLSLIILLMIGTNYAFFPLRDGILFIIVTDAILGIGVYYYVQQFRLAHLDYLECEENGLTWWNHKGKQRIRFDEITALNNRRWLGEIVVKSKTTSIVIPKYADQFDLFYTEIEKGLFNAWSEQIGDEKVIFKTMWKERFLRVVSGGLLASACFSMEYLYDQFSEGFMLGELPSIDRIVLIFIVIIILIILIGFLASQKKYLLFPEAIMVKTINGFMVMDIAHIEFIKYDKEEGLFIQSSINQRIITISESVLNIPTQVLYRFLIHQYRLKEISTLPNSFE